MKRKTKTVRVAKKKPTQQKPEASLTGKPALSKLFGQIKKFKIDSSIESLPVYGARGTTYGTMTGICPSLCSSSGAMQSMGCCC